MPSCRAGKHGLFENSGSWFEENLLLQTVQDGWKDMLRSHYRRDDGMDLEEDMRKEMK